MKSIAFTLGLIMLAGPASAQFGKLDDALKKVEKAKRIADVRISDSEERQIGQQVSDKIVEEFGVYQDANVTKYVTLVGSVLAQASTRPGLSWQFVVLDTDGVNAFAAPGGLVHITRGLLGLIKSEAELAGVLAHEIIHVTGKHTVNAIQKNDTVKMTKEEVNAQGGLTEAVVTRLADEVYTNVLNNNFSRSDENESDEKGVELANKVGYAPAGLSTVLTRLSERNKDAKEPNGLFASHPVIKDRIANIAKTIRDRKLTATATVAQRYAMNISFEAKPVGDIAMVPAGSRGLAGAEDKKDGDKAKEKTEDSSAQKSSSGGGLLGRLKPGGTQAQQSQTVASAGARGVNPDRDAVGGSNKTRVPVKVGPTEIAEFRKGIA